LSGISTTASAETETAQRQSIMCPDCAAARNSATVIQIATAPSISEAR